MQVLLGKVTEDDQHGDVHKIADVLASAGEKQGMLTYSCTKCFCNAVANTPAHNSCWCRLGTSV
jgi:hypothetical protein